MLDFNLISDIALGDTDFQKRILETFKTESLEFIRQADILKGKNAWVAIHIRAKSYRNKVAPMVTDSALEKINATLEILISPLNNSAKQYAYQALSTTIKRHLSRVNLSV